MALCPLGHFTALLPCLVTITNCLKWPLCPLGHFTALLPCLVTINNCIKWPLCPLGYFTALLPCLVTITNCIKWPLCPPDYFIHPSPKHSLVLRSKVMLLLTLTAMANFYQFPCNLENINPLITANLYLVILSVLQN